MRSPFCHRREVRTATATATAAATAAASAAAAANATATAGGTGTGTTAIGTGTTATATSARCVRGAWCTWCTWSARGAARVRAAAPRARRPRAVVRRLAFRGHLSARTYRQREAEAVKCEMIKASKMHGQLTVSQRRSMRARRVSRGRERGGERAADAPQQGAVNATSRRNSLHLISSSPLVDDTRLSER